MKFLLSSPKKIPSTEFHRIRKLHKFYKILDNSIPTGILNFEI